MTSNGVDISVLNIAGPGIWAARYSPRFLANLMLKGIDFSFIDIAGPGHAQC